MDYQETNHLSPPRQTIKSSKRGQRYNAKENALQSIRKEKRRGKKPFVIVARSIHAVGVSALRCHRRGGDVGGHLDVIDVATKGLTVVAEGLSHKSSDAKLLLVTKFVCLGSIRNLPPNYHLIKHRAPQTGNDRAELSDILLIQVLLK